MATDRTQLDTYLTVASEALAKREGIEPIGSANWWAAHRKAQWHYRRAAVERKRLFRLDPWGAWMNETDKELARITGEL